MWTKSLLIHKSGFSPFKVFFKLSYFLLKNDTIAAYNEAIAPKGKFSFPAFSFFGLKSKFVPNLFLADIELLKRLVEILANVSLKFFCCLINRDRLLVQNWKVKFC